MSICAGSTSGVGGMGTLRGRAEVPSAEPEREHSSDGPEGRSETKIKSPSRIDPTRTWRRCRSAVRSRSISSDPPAGALVRSITGTLAIPGIPAESGCGRRPMAAREFRDVGAYLDEKSAEAQEAGMGWSEGDGLNPVSLNRGVDSVPATTRSSGGKGDRP